MRWPWRRKPKRIETFVGLYTSQPERARSEPIPDSKYSRAAAPKGEHFRTPLELGWGKITAFGYTDAAGRYRVQELTEYDGKHFSPQVVTDPLGATWTFKP